LTTKRQRTFSPEQAAYIVAKAAHEAILVQVGSILNDLLDTSGALDNDAEIEAYCEREAQVHREFGTLQAEQRLRQAEQAVLDWGLTRIKQTGLAGKEQLAMIERLVATPLVSYRNRAIDLIMRLDA
jgi:hypothetical protein